MNISDWNYRIAPYPSFNISAGQGIVSNWKRHIIKCKNMNEISNVENINMHLLLCFQLASAITGAMFILIQFTEVK